MKFFIGIAALLFMAFQSVAASDIDSCEAGADFKIERSGYFDQSDKARLVEQCEAFQRVLENPVEKNAYVLLQNDFTCINIHDYKQVYNWIIDRGGKYRTSQVDGFKSCNVVKRSAVAVAVEGDGDLVWVVYHSAASLYVLDEGWVLGGFLVDYAAHQGAKL